MRKYDLRAAPVSVLIGSPGVGPHCAVTTRLTDAAGELRVSVGVVSSREAATELRLLAGQERVRFEVFVSRSAVLQELAARHQGAVQRYLLRCARTQQQAESRLSLLGGCCCCVLSWFCRP